MSASKVRNSQTAILQKFYDKKKAERSGYSLAVLARTVGLSVPFLSQMIRGQRAIPLENFHELSRALDLDVESREELLKRLLEAKGLKGKISPLAASPRELDSASDAATWTAAPAQHFNVLEHWYTIAILDATLLREYDGTSRYLADRLGLPLSTVETTLAKLQDAGLLESNGGMLRKRALLMEFNSAREQAAITNFNRELLERAKQTLNEETSATDRERRLVTGLVITGSAEKVAWAKQTILGVMRSVAAAMSDSPSEELYQLSVQLIPLTKPTPASDDENC